MRGKNNSHWKGGFSDSKKWYKKVWMPNHPHAHNNYIYVHRLIMEQNIGRYLETWEEVHHIDKNIHNNDISNLLLTDKKSHPTEHRKDMSDRRCLKCGSDKTYIIKTWSQWHKYKNGFLCRKCFRITKP